MDPDYTEELINNKMTKFPYCLGGSLKIFRLFTCRAECKVPFDYVEHIIREYEMDGSTEIKVVNKILQRFD